MTVHTLAAIEGSATCFTDVQAPNNVDSTGLRLSSACIHDRSSINYNNKQITIEGYLQHIIYAYSNGVD